MIDDPSQEIIISCIGYIHSSSHDSTVMCDPHNMKVGMYILNT